MERYVTVPEQWRFETRRHVGHRPAAAASIISAPQAAGHSRGSSYETTLLIFAFLSLAASLVVMAIRHILVRRGLMMPLSMKAEGTVPERAAAGAGQDAARR